MNKYVFKRRVCVCVLVYLVLLNKTFNTRGGNIHFITREIILAFLVHIAYLNVLRPFFGLFDINGIIV